MDTEHRRDDDRLVELIAHLAGCSPGAARGALDGVGPSAEGLTAVAHALALLRRSQP